MKVLAVGDIHTKLWIIDEVRKIMDNYDRVVFVGDYADDWKATAIDTLNTWIELRSLSHAHPHVKLVTGNHDFIYAHKTPTLQSGYSHVTQLLIDATENKGLKEWLKNLPIQLDIDNVTYTHAGRDVNWNTSTDPHFLWANDSPIWNRPGKTVYGPEAQVFGHTPQSTCTEVDTNVWCIDTFSTYPNGEPIGDHTALEIIDGKTFNKIKIGNKNGNNNSTASVKTRLP